MEKLASDRTYQKVALETKQLKQDLSQRSFGGIGNLSKANISSICHLEDTSEFKQSFRLQKRTPSLKSENGDYNLQKCELSLASLVDQIAKKEVSSLNVTERSASRVGNALGFNAPSELVEASEAQTIEE